MKVILRENVDGLGLIGDVVNVKPGYARNYLLPKGFALRADSASLKELEHQKRQLEFKRQKAAADAEALKARIESLSFTFEERAGEEGKLFGSVTNMDIEVKLKDAAVDIDRRKIQLAEPIKTVGEHPVAIKLDAGVVAEITVAVTAAEAVAE